MSDNSPFKKLPNTRESQVMILASEGYTDKQISTELGISTDTVSTYWRRILSRYRASSRTEVIATLYKEHMVDTDQELEGLQIELRNRRFAERNLEVSLARLSALMNRISSAVLFENDQRQILFVNRAYTDLFGPDYDTAQLNGRLSDSLTPAYASKFSDPSAIETFITEAVRKEGAIAPLRAQAKTGQIYEISYSPIKSEADRLGHMWHFRDVTAFALLEMQSMMNAKIGDESTKRMNELISCPVDDLILFANDSLAGIGNSIRAKRIHVYMLANDESAYRERVSWSRDNEQAKVHEIPISLYGHSKEESTQVQFVPPDGEGLISASTAAIRRLVTVRNSDSALVLPVLNRFQDGNPGKAASLVVFIFESTEKGIQDGYVRILGSFFTLLASKIRLISGVKNGI